MVSTFTITVKAFWNLRTYRMQVEHYFSSHQVERFKIYGRSEKSILLEKNLLAKRYPWKIIGGEIGTRNFEEAALGVREIQKELDRYLLDRSA